MRRGGDAGAAVVDFVLVSVLVLALFLLVLQVGLVLHVRNVVTAAAAEGARYGAAADRTPEEGAARAQRAIGEGLGGRVSRAIRCTSGVVGVQGVPTVEITCRGAAPVVFLPSPVVRLTVRGHALEESR